MIYKYEYPRPMVTVDVLVFRTYENNIELLLIKRKNNPFKDLWALPGGFVNENESLIDAVNRELFEETGLTGLKLEQFYTFGEPGRDPRGHCISIVFSAIDVHNNEPKAGDDAKAANWFKIDKLPPLAFDHHEIINQFIKERI